MNNRLREQVTEQIAKINQELANAHVCNPPASIIVESEAILVFQTFSPRMPTGVIPVRREFPYTESGFSRCKDCVREFLCYYQERERVFPTVFS